MLLREDLQNWTVQRVVENVVRLAINLAIIQFADNEETIKSTIFNQINILTFPKSYFQRKLYFPSNYVFRCKYNLISSEDSNYRRQK